MAYTDDPNTANEADERNDPGHEESIIESARFREAINTSERLALQANRNVRKLWRGFLDFAMQGNVLEIAFGLIIASAFTGIVNSFVTDIVLPPIAIILPMNKNLDEKFAVLKPGPSFEVTGGDNTLQQAQEDGAVVMAYGIFLNRLLNFMGVGFVLYTIAATYQHFSHDPIIKHMIKCRYCRKWINEKAKRCVNCTSWLDGREDH